MTHSPGEFLYKVLAHEWQLARVYERMRTEDLLWAAWPDEEEMDERYFIQRLGRDDTLVIGGYVDGELAGIMTLTAVAKNTLCAEIGLTAFRQYFGIAHGLCHGALLWAFELTGAKSFIGRIAAAHRHILRMFAALGFYELGRVPGMIWHARRHKFMDAVIVVARPDTIRGL